MSKKYCLFCDQIVSTKPEGNYDIYLGCSCSPDGFYSLLSESYEPINSLPHQKKRDMLHIVSAYIRELTDCDEKVSLSADDLESIVNSPKIPVSVEDKGNRLLQHLYRHSEGAGESVVIQPLSSSYNLTYSPNLQELVYIIDKLINEQCGYLPRLLTHTNTPKEEKYPMDLIMDSKLVIGDLTGQSPEVYFAAGYALGKNIPVIWTVNSSDADNLCVQNQDIRPLVWDSADELAVILQQRLAG